MTDIYRVLSRAECALAPARRLTNAPTKRAALFLHHTVTATTTDPCADWRVVQRVAFGRGFADISYTFGVHPSGAVMEGRSPSAVGAHTEKHNSTAHAIVLIGNYDEAEPPPAMLGAVRWLRAEMVRRGLLTADHSFRPHSAVKATACPGARVRARFAEFAPAPQPNPEELALQIPGYFKTLVAPNGGWWHAARDGGVFAVDDGRGSQVAPFYGSAANLLPIGAKVVDFVPHGHGYAFVVQHSDNDVTGYHFPGTA